MMGHKAGDNSQILALAEGLGWPFEIKHLVYRPTELLTNLLAPLTLLGIVRQKSSPLAPPWPDLIISAGRRNEPPCRWIQARADKRVRLVHVGRPWALIENFDLVVTTPQYRLPRRPNVLHNTTPLQRVAHDRLREAAARWAPRLAHLPRPYTAVMIGGNAGPYVLDREAATLLGRAASAFARRRGGSLLVSTSARTPKETTRAARGGDRLSGRRLPLVSRRRGEPLPRLSGARRLDHRDLREHVDADRGVRDAQAGLHVRPAHRPGKPLGAARAPDRQGRHVAVAAPPAAALPAARLSHRIRDRPDPHDPRRAHHPAPAGGAAAGGVAGRRRSPTAPCRRRWTTCRAPWPGSGRCSRTRPGRWNRRCPAPHRGAPAPTRKPRPRPPSAHPR